MSALREILAKFTIDTSDLDKAAGRGDSSIGKLTSGLKGFALALGGVAIVSGIKSMVTDLAEQAKQLEVSSEKLGINTDDLQRWHLAAKLSGSSAEQFEGALKKLQKNSADAATAGAQSGGEFQKLGVQLRTTAGGPMRDTQDILYDTGIAISKLKDPAERTQAAMKTFGRAGTDLIPMFAKGEEGLKAYLGELDKLGGGISKRTIADLANMKANMERLDTATTGLKARIVGAFVPALTAGITKLTSWSVHLLDTKEGAAALATGVLALGAAAGVAGVAFLAPWLPAITAFTVLGLLIQDFIVGLKGGDSEIGHVMDKLFGAGAGDSFFVGVKKDVRALIDEIRTLIEDLQDLGRGIKQTINDPLNRKGVSGEDALAEVAHDVNERETRKKRDEARAEADKYHPPPEKKVAGELSQDAIDRVKYEVGHNEGIGGVDLVALQNTNVDALKKVFSPDVFAKVQAAMGPGSVGPNGAAPAPAEQKPVEKNVTQTNTTSITINAPSGDADAIAGAVGDGQAAANRAALDALDKRAN